MKHIAKKKKNDNLTERDILIDITQLKWLSINGIRFVKVILL